MVDLSAVQKKGTGREIRHHSLSGMVLYHRESILLWVQAGIATTQNTGDLLIKPPL
ncbi:hypothetical protein DMNBHIDG_01233 [Candidatus Methanoperedenaceae archaeon GB37]|nr:hypothetical protein DMNBHIDG_01233 [Candidatus Methanoperedenaceae archaeon GB37]